jgi:RNA polymerase sigma factor (sigma-70 family)
VTTSATHRAIDAVWRIESARLIAGLTRIVRDVSVAEDLAQDALVAALEQWPESGIPDVPGAWLMATAKRRGIDALRRRITLERKQELIARELETLQQLDQPDLAAQVDDVEDDVLRLVFMTCHPVLSREARVALTLRLGGGLSTPEIARAFLTSEGTVASASSAPSAHSARPSYRSRCLAATSSPSASPPCWRSSTSSSTRATRRPRASIGPGRRCARTPCGWAGSSPR